MNKSWRVIFAFAGIFVAGVVAGVLVAPRLFTNVVERRGPPPAGRPQFQPNQLLGPQLFRRLAEQLDLTVEQREKIKPIELRVTEELRRLRRESQHNTELALERMQDEISALLTPAQRTKFEEQIARGRERIKKLQDSEIRQRREPGAMKGQRDGGPPPK